MRHLRDIFAQYLDRSAGLITHPDFVEDTKAYQSKYGLTNSPGIKMLSYIPNFLGMCTYQLQILVGIISS